MHAYMCVVCVCASRSSPSAFIAHVQDSRACVFAKVLGNGHKGKPRIVKN